MSEVTKCNRIVIKFCVKLKKRVTEMSQMLKSGYGEECLSSTGVFEWHKRFKEGRASLQDSNGKAMLPEQKN
jgi:hypothetical protein